MLKNAFTPLLFLTLTLSACGFHLRGSNQSPDWLNPLYVQMQTPNNDSLNKIKQELSLNRIHLSKRFETAKTILTIISYNYTSTTIVSASNKEYTISLDVEYRLNDLQGKTILTGKTRQQTEYDSPNDRLLATDQQLDLAHKTLTQGFVNSLILRATYLKK